MKRMAILMAVVALLLLGTIALAQSSGHDPPILYTVEQGVAAGEGYRLTSMSWQASGVASGGGYYLLGPASPASSENGCCCLWLPCTLRNQ